MGGAARPSGPGVLALPGLKGAEPTRLSADGIMPISLWHIPHILGVRYTVWFLGGRGGTVVRRPESIPRSKAAVLAPSVAGLAHGEAPHLPWLSGWRRSCARSVSPHPQQPG